MAKVMAARFDEILRQSWSVPKIEGG